MDTSSRSFSINSSSLVSLKAELLRKEQEYLDHKHKRPDAVKKKIKPDGIGAQNAGVTGRAAKDLEEKLINDNETKNSREILEKKAKLYEAMAKGYIEDDDTNENCLVDFHQKQRSRDQKKVTEWAPVSGKSEVKDFNRGPITNISEEAGTSPTGSLHYANVQHKEIRTHGVGYYQFSEDNKKRQEQMELLDKLRSQTEDQKAKKERLQEKKRNLMAQRMARMRERRGLPEPKPEEEEPEQKTEVPEVVPLKRDDTWRNLAPITREWDKGKNRDVNKSYLERRRDQRPTEFAPPVEFQLDSSMRAAQNSRPSHSSSTKPAAAHTHKPRLTMKADDIEQALKSIRSETEKQGTTPATESPSVVKLNPLSRETPPVPVGATIVGLEEIPLPPSGPTGPTTDTLNTVPPEPVLTTPACSGSVPLTCTPVLTYPGTLPQTTAAHGANSQLTVGPGVAVPDAANTGTSYTPYGVPHWQDVDTTQPPPALPAVPPPFTHPVPPALPGPPLSSHPGVSTLQAPTDLIESQDSDMSSGVTSWTSDAAVTTLYGSPAESAADRGSSLKRHLAPQPAHYSSAPSKVQIVRPAYERVHLHQLPLTLPAPPSEHNVPQYKAQDAAHIPAASRDHKQNRNIIHKWKTQFDYKEPK